MRFPELCYFVSILSMFDRKGSMTSFIMCCGLSKRHNMLLLGEDSSFGTRATQQHHSIKWYYMKLYTTVSWGNQHFLGRSGREWSSRSLKTDPTISLSPCAPVANMTVVEAESLETLGQSQTKTNPTCKANRVAKWAHSDCFLSFRAMYRRCCWFSPSPKRNHINNIRDQQHTQDE